MAADHPPRDSFLAAIEAKIAAWTAVLESYKAAVSLDAALGEAGGGHVPARHGHGDNGRPMDLPVGVFRDKSLKEAIAIYLGAGRRKQTNKEIAQGLQKGGIATTSTNFEATVATALGRMKDEGTILRFPDGWDLASSYPDNLRNRLEKEARPKRPSRSASRKAATARKPRTPKADDKTVQMLGMIQQSEDGLTVGEIVTGFQALGVECSRDYVRVVTKRLRGRGKIRVGDDGKFYAVTA